jgi:O-antigen/teichoic acid export membrane protein
MSYQSGRLRAREPKPPTPLSFPPIDCTLIQSSIYLESCLSFHSRFEHWRAFLAPKLHRVVEFFTLQGITLAGNLFFGFLCVRLLPIPEYAKYAVVFGFLGTLTIFMDVGFSNALLPLIGERIDDLRLIADYVATLRQLAHWLFLLIAPATIILYPLIVRRQQWSVWIVAVMIAILLVSAWCARVSGAYGAVLIVRRDRKSWYRVRMIYSIGGLVLLVIAWKAHILNGLCAMLINLIGLIYMAVAYFLQAQHLLGVPGVATREKRKAMVHFTAPNLPNTIFYALQGQISLLLITYFGHATAVASVGALARLGQIFILFSQMTPLLIEPYFAKLPRARLKRNYLGVFAIEVVICGAFIVLARFFPGIFLWILGHQYSGLRYEVFLMIAISSISYLYGVLWVVHNACRFVYWWNSFFIVTLTLVIQILFIWKADLSTIRGVLYMNLCTTGAMFVVMIATGIYGFIFGPRKIAETHAVVIETDYA